MSRLNRLNSGVALNSSAVSAGLSFRAPVSSTQCSASRRSAMLSSLRFPGPLLISQWPTDDVLQQSHEALSVSSFPIIEAKRLFIDLAEQVERLEIDVGSSESSLKHRPETSNPFVCQFPRTYSSAWFTN